MNHIEEQQRVKGTRSMFWILSPLLFLCLLFSGMVIWWNVRNYDILQIKGPVTVRPVTVRPDSAKGKDYIFLTIDFCKTSNAKGRATVYAVQNEQDIPLIQFNDNTEKRCEVADFPLRLPKDIPSGDTFIKMVIKYHANPVRIEDETIVSEHFTVL